MERREGIGQPGPDGDRGRGHTTTGLLTCSLRSDTLRSIGRQNVGRTGDKGPQLGPPLLQNTPVTDTTTTEVRRQLVDLARPATALTAGGFRPTGESTESWVGRVFLHGPDERPPVDGAGEPMLPLAQLHLPSFPHVPEALQGVCLLTVFISSRLPAPFEVMGSNWTVREYTSLDGLTRADPEHAPVLRPFPLGIRSVSADYPMWDSDDVPLPLAQELLALEETGEIPSYCDLTEHHSGHKVGGYPSFCQSGVAFGEGFDFAFQVSSDPKVGLNVVDGGSLMFARNRSTKGWALYYDFY